MLFRYRTLLVTAVLSLPCLAQVQWDDSLLKPYVIDHRAATSSPADVSFLHDAPAGKDGYIRVQGGHFLKPDGKRIRFWGVHLTDWSPGSIELPAKEDTPMWARTLARYGVNIVRLHFVDKWAPTGITDGNVGDPYDISLDPVRMTEMAAGALMFLRGDVKPARQTVERTYSMEQVLDAGMLPGGLRPGSEQPYFTPGFPLALPLEHAVRIKSFDGPATAQLTASGANPIVSDTRELSWYTSGAKTGLVTVETDHAQALIGFIEANRKTLKNLGADIANNFAAIVLTSLDDEPLARSGRMLLNACSRVANTDQKWNDAHSELGRGGQGHSPTLIEPVTGTVTLRGIEGAQSVSAAALDGSGKPIGDPIAGKKTAAGWEIAVGAPVTTWYVVTVARK